MPATATRLPPRLTRNGLPASSQWVIRKMSEARAALDWEAQFALSMDPERARELRARALPADAEVCTMCGELCAVRLYAEGCAKK